MGWGDDIVTHLIPKAKQGRCENGAFVVSDDKVVSGL